MRRASPSRGQRRSRVDRRGRLRTAGTGVRVATYVLPGSFHDSHVLAKFTLGLGQGASTFGKKGPEIDQYEIHGLSLGRSFGVKVVYILDPGAVLI